MRRSSQERAQQQQASGPRTLEGRFHFIADLLDKLQGDSQILLKRRLRHTRPAQPRLRFRTVGVHSHGEIPRPEEGCRQVAAAQH
jgi:hypothetical protein